MDFLKGLSIKDDHHDKKPEAHQQPAQAHPVEGKGLFDKLTDAIKDELNPQGQQQQQQQQHHQTPPPVQTSGGLLGKLSDALGDHKTSNPTPPPTAAPTHDKNESIFDKLGDRLSGRKTPPPPPPPQSLFDKIESAVTGKANNPPPKSHGLGDKINEALGGGHKAEAKEGKLDKAIDLFQEHVLKEGPQHNESALEQAKDKTIADTIRKAVGIPEKDSKK